MKAAGNNDFILESFSVVRDFRRLYTRAADEGRGEALFGADTLEQGTAALRRGAVEGMEKGVSFYFEFPFIGAPRMDLMVSYNCSDLPRDISFAEGEDYGQYARFFKECAADPALCHYICGFSFDLSDMADKTEEKSMPGIYLLPSFDRPNVDYVPMMLTRLGGAERVPGVMAAFAAAPKSWQPYYAGYMPGRRGAPTRLGFFVSTESQLRYKKNPEFLGREVSSYAHIPWTDKGRKLMAELIEGDVYDLQFDLYPNGTFGNDVGVTLNLGFNDVDARYSAGYLEKGVAGRIMDKLEAAGLADERWRLMDDACCGVQCIVQQGGRRHLKGDMVKLNALKVRFKKGAAYIAKGYLFGRSSFL